MTQVYLELIEWSKVLVRSDHNRMQPERAGSFWGHVLVSLCACILTVSIMGSAVFLVWRVYDRQHLRERVSGFVSSLRNRTPEELAERAESLKAHPKVARYVVPEIRKSIKEASSDLQRCCAIQISRAFLNDEGVEKTLFSLRDDPAEAVAAAAVRVLSELQPPERASEIIGRCLLDAEVPAAVDEACAALYRLGNTGLMEMSRRKGNLTPGRRLWLVGYVAGHHGPLQRAWLSILKVDEDARVREAAEEALTALDKPATATVSADTAVIDEG